MSKKMEEVLNPDLVWIIDECSKKIKDEISKISLRDLSSGKKLMSMVIKQKHADKIRSKNEKRGIEYPAVVIVDRQNKSISAGLQLWDRIIEECRNAGVSIVAFAEEDLLVEKSIWTLLAKYPEIIFPILINSECLNEELVNYFYNTRNVIPIIELKNFNQKIDLSILKKNNILYVLYVKTNSKNLESVLNKKIIDYYYNNGCKAFLFMEEKGKINNSEIGILEETMKFFMEKYKGIFFNFPGNENRYKDTLENGIGFCYISSKCEMVYGEPLNSSNIIASLLNCKLRDIREAQDIYK